MHNNLFQRIAKAPPAEERVLPRKSRDTATMKSQPPSGGETPALISGDLNALATACTTHNRVSFRLWSFAALIGLIVVTGKVSDVGVSVLGFKMEAFMFYPACGVLLALINIAYCSAHLQAYRTAQIYHDYLDTIGANETALSVNFSLADAAHALFVPALNRAFPLTHFLPERSRNLTFLLVKIPMDVFFYSVPIAASMFALFKLVVDAEFSWWWIPLGFVLAVSLAATFIILLTALRWTVSGPVKMAQAATTRAEQAGGDQPATRHGVDAS